MATDTRTPYRTGLCQMGNHVLCKGEYSFARCHCHCHAWEQHGQPPKPAA